jgi:predicted transcriptional regulator of viral defense system
MVSAEAGRPQLPATIREAVFALREAFPHKMEWKPNEIFAELKRRDWLGGRHANSVSTALGRMAESGEITHVRKGLYRLSPQDATEDPSVAYAGRDTFAPRLGVDSP